MSKHTPGPWEADNVDTGFSGYECHILADEAQPGAKLPAIAAGATAEECRANALLIAAAPQLLSELEAMVDMFERHIDGREGPDDAAARWDSARAAISSARGGDE